MGRSPHANDFLGVSDDLALVDLRDDCHDVLVVKAVERGRIVRRTGWMAERESCVVAVLRATERVDETRRRARVECRTTGGVGNGTEGAWTVALRRSATACELRTI